MNEKIAVVDDEIDILELLKINLKNLDITHTFFKKVKIY